MASFFFNLFKGDPSSPSLPPSQQKSDSDSDREDSSNDINNNSNSSSSSSDIGIAHYAGTFDLNTGCWTSIPQENNRSNTLKQATGKELPPSYRRSKRNDPASTNFCEVPITISNLNKDYDNELEANQPQSPSQRKNENDDDDDNDDVPPPSTSVPTATSATQVRNFIRLVVLSDSHQYHDFVKLPKGDVLIHCGDILMTDRFNFGFISNRYLSQFLEWFNDSKQHPHPVKLIIGGNHCAQMEALYKNSPQEFEKLVKPAIFLTGDEVIEAFGVRFFGNSWSTSTGSGNVAFQGKDVFEKLENVATKIDQSFTNSNQYPTVDVKVRNVTNTTPSSSTSSTSTARNPQATIDVLISHCNMPKNKYIIQGLNPALHLNGHYHGYHGLRRGTGRTNLANVISRFPHVDKTNANPFLVREIPNVNASIVASLSGKSPRLNPPMVIDIVPLKK